MAKIFMLMDDPRARTGYAYTNRLTIKNFKKLGHECIAFTFNSSGKAAGEWEGCPIINHLSSPIKNDNEYFYGTKEFLIKKYNELKPDILFFHNDFYRQSWFFDLPKEIRKKSIWWLPLDVLEKSENTTYLEEIDNLYFVTNHAKKIVGLHDKIVIPHAIDDKYFNKNYTKKNDKFTICRVDRHQARKQWPYTLHAFSIFAKDKNDVMFYAKCNPQDESGKDPETNEFIDLELFSKDIGIDKDKIHFFKDFIEVENIIDKIYDKSHCFLTTTGSEGFGLAIAESMARGCIPIYPNGSSLPEVADNNGYCYEYSKKRIVKNINALYGWPDVNEVAKQLDMAYNTWKEDKHKFEEDSKKCIISSKKYNSKKIYKKWDSEIKKIMKENKENIKYSIVIVTKNNLQMLSQCIDSIEFMTKESHEIIVVDNCSDEYLKNEFNRKYSKNKNIKLVINNKEGGFTYANNLGIKAACGEYVVLLNNDTIILSENWLNELNNQLDISGADLIGPSTCWMFISKNKEEIPNKLINSGYIYFNEYNNAYCCNFTGFWLVLAKKDLFINMPLNEKIKSYLYDDADYCLRLQENGKKWVSLNGQYNDGKELVQHLGEQSRKPEDIHRNELARKEFFESWSDNELEETYIKFSNIKSDINEHLPKLKEYGEKCEYITEFGVRDVVSTYAFLAAKPKKLISYDINTSNNILNIYKLAKNNKISFGFFQEDVLNTNIEETDLLFIDTFHTYKQLKSELEKHYNKVKKYIILHDTITFGEVGEDGSEGLIKAIDEFLKNSKDWTILEHCLDNNGLMVLGKNIINDKNIISEKITITIPTRNREDYLIKLLESLKKQTFKNWDLIICNDSVDFGTDVLNKIKEIRKKHNVKILKGHKRGPAKAHDMMFRKAKTEWIFRIDDDNTLDEKCLETLVKESKNMENVVAIAPLVLSPFKSVNEQTVVDFDPPKVVIEDFLSAASLQQYIWNKSPVLTKVEHLHSCFMYRKSLAEKVGGFIYNENKDSIVSYGEETIFSYKLFKLGYNLLVCKNAKTFHYLAENGGTRDNSSVYNQNRLIDFEIFKKEIQKII